MTPCPSINELRDFNSGRIANPIDIDRISKHLYHCHRCIDELDLMGPDPLAAGLKKSQDSKYDTDQDDDYSSAAFTQVMSRISIQDLTGFHEPESLGENLFQVLGLIGTGHYGTSFLACVEPEELYRIKIPDAHQITSKQHYDQFCNDCRFAQSLEHPNIQTPIEFGHWDETRFYFSANYLGLQPSLTLTNLTKKAFADNPLPCKVVIAIFGQILETIDYAHSKSIWHRQLTPDNIWVLNEDNEISITIGDFGFSLDSRYQFELLEKIQNPNTFMSPETVNNDATYIDQRTDIFSIGRILKVLLKVCVALPPACDVAEIQKIIAKCTQLRRSERYQTIGELKQDWDSVSKDLH